MAVTPSPPPAPSGGARGTTAWLSLGGRAVPEAGPPLEIHEATPLGFALSEGREAHVLLGGLPIPFAADGRADALWVEDARREQWVGELDLVVVPTSGGTPLRPRVVVLPKRTTVEGFGFLVDQFRGWAGAGALTDPAGRARIWAELAPRVPAREEERALVALMLLRRALPAFLSIHRAPATAPAERRGWSPIERTGGRRVLLRRLHPFDPPRPLEAPRTGRVATVTVEPSPDRAENRYVVGVVRRLLAMARQAEATGGLGPAGELRGLAAVGLEDSLVDELRDTAAALQRMVAEPPWLTLPPGPPPRISFLLRDHPHYRIFRTVGDALDDSLRFSPIPGDPAALGLRTQTLNALFEVWVAQAVRSAARRRLGLATNPGAPLPRGGAEEIVTAAGRLRVCFDRVYPRVATPGSVFALTGKRSPDAAVEWWPAATGGVEGRPVIMAVDATWSRNPTYHDDKLGYARSLAYGDADPMTGLPRLCVRRSLVVFPGPRPAVRELGFALSLATVSAPPSAGGWELLGAYLDRALEGVVPAGVTPRPGSDRFTEVADIAARS